MKFSYENSNVTDAEIASSAKRLEQYRNELSHIISDSLYENDEASLCLPGDSRIYDEVLSVYQTKNVDKLKYVILIGIGGSNLGAKAVYEAICGEFDKYSVAKHPRLLFLDTTSTRELNAILKLLDSVEDENEILVNIISKSGETTTTIVNAEIVIDKLVKQFGEGIFNRIIFTTDENSKLKTLGESKGITTLFIPKMVGGRFSVLSAVGLLPLILSRVDIESLIAGAVKIREDCLSSDINKNPAMLSAIILNTLREKGYSINSNFIFNKELESLGKWYRQLLGESVGKEKDLSGNTVNIGITPEVSIGPTDLHSVGQLYLGGPKDKITTFIHGDVDGDVDIPKEMIFDGFVENINSKSVNVIMDAILRGVKNTYKEKELPFMEVNLERVNPYSIGEFLQFKMIEIMYLGRLMNVNTFDQPNVESYKEETKNILKESK
jgi:glucose-6-phosphate isomerase